MKLIRCEIQNFGKIRKGIYEFKDGCNAFCERNGWGKSTLAAFIKIMLYGFENERTVANSRTKEEDSDLGRAVFTEASLYLNPMERPTRLKEFSEAGKKMISSV